MAQIFQKKSKARIFLTSFLLGTSCLSASIAFADGEEFPTPEFSFKDTTLGTGKALEQEPFDYRAPSKSFKGFLLFAGLSVSQSYNTNIRADHDNAESDFVTTIEPSLRIDKELSRHRFYVKTDAKIKRTAKNKDENTDDHNILLAADIEAFQGLRIPLRAGLSSAHTLRTSNTSDRKTRTPTQTNTKFVNGGFVYDPNLLSVSANIEHQKREHKNNSFIDTNQPIILEDGDVDITAYNFKLAYRVQPNLEPFLRLKYEDASYIRPVFENGSFSGSKRDNQYTQYLIGTVFNYKGLIYGDTAIGIDKREYSDASIESTSNFSYEGQVYWEPTRKSKFGLSFSKNSVEDNEITEGYDGTSINLSYNHELQRDLFGRVHAGYNLKEFSSLSRTDEDYIGGLDLKYFLSPRFQIGAEYLYTNRQSTANDTGFDQSQMTLRLTGAL